MRQQLTRLRAALLSCVALVTLSLSVTVVPSVAAAAGTPGPTTLADAYNLGNSASTADVACATTTCAAVGSFTTSGGTTVPFVSVTTGSSWVTTAVPVTSGSASAVQCPTDNFCVATGTSMTNAVGSAWVGVWSGQSWQFSPLGTTRASPVFLTVRGGRVRPWRPCSTSAVTLRPLVFRAPVTARALWLAT